MIRSALLIWVVIEFGIICNTALAAEHNATQPKATHTEDVPKNPVGESLSFSEGQYKAKDSELVKNLFGLSYTDWIDEKDLKVVKPFLLENVPSNLTHSDTRFKLVFQDDQKKYKAAQAAHKNWTDIQKCLYCNSYHPATPFYTSCYKKFGLSFAVYLANPAPETVVIAQTYASENGGKFVNIYDHDLVVSRCREMQM